MGDAKHTRAKLKKQNCTSFSKLSITFGREHCTLKNKLRLYYRNVLSNYVFNYCRMQHSQMRELFNKIMKPFLVSIFKLTRMKGESKDLQECKLSLANEIYVSEFLNELEFPKHGGSAAKKRNLVTCLLLLFIHLMICSVQIIRNLKFCHSSI